MVALAARHHRAGSGGLLAFDDFSEADGTALAGKAADTGQLWTVHEGVWAVSGGKVSVTSGGGAGVSASLDVGKANALVRARIVIPSAGGPGLVGRVTDANNLYMVEVTATSTKLFKRVSGTYTQLGSTGAALGGAGATVLVGFRMSGSALTVFDGAGNAVIAVTDSTYTTQTRHGLGGFAPGTGTWDDVAVTA